MVHKIICIYGKVQGVGYRFAAMRKAEMLSIKGIVRNNFDGSVYIEAEGSAINISEFIQWCREGPANAYVNDVIVKDGEFKNYKSFFIRY